MKSTLLIPASVLLLGALTALPAADSAPAVPIPAVAPTRTFTEPEMLEMLGWLAGDQSRLSQLSFTEAELASVSKGFVSAASGKLEPFKRDDIEAQFTTCMDAKVAAMKQSVEEKQKKFLAETKGQKDVVSLPSGLLYEIVKPGTGAYPKSSDTVKVIYTGMLIDGTVFDATSRHPDEAASNAAGKFVATKLPDEFPLSGVIPGWTEGIQKINKGGKIKLYVPSELAYRDNPPPGSPIQPGATLVFEVELIDIK